MILQKHLVEYPVPEKAVGKKITIPGLGVSIANVMQMYARGSLEERAKGYYEKKGMEVPDFAMMSKIERMEALSEYQKTVINENKKLDTVAEKIEAAKKEAILQKKIKDKVDEQQQQQGPSKDKQGGA